MSTTDTIAEFIDFLLLKLDNNINISGTFLVLSKAFGTIHKILLSKLEWYYGCDTKAFLFFA